MPTIATAPAAQIAAMPAIATPALVLPSLDDTLAAIAAVCAQVPLDHWTKNGINESTFIGFTFNFAPTSQVNADPVAKAHRRNFRALVRSGRLVHMGSNPCSSVSCYAPPADCVAPVAAPVAPVAVVEATAIPAIESGVVLPVTLTHAAVRPALQPNERPTADQVRIMRPIIAQLGRELPEILGAGEPRGPKISAPSAQITTTPMLPVMLSAAALVTDLLAPAIVHDGDCDCPLCEGVHDRDCGCPLCEGQPEDYEPFDSLDKLNAKYPLEPMVDPFAEDATVFPVTANKIAAPAPQMFVALPHNAQPGMGSLPHFMPSRRAHHGVCSMCPTFLKPFVKDGVAGTWCESCRFFTASEGAK